MLVGEEPGFSSKRGKFAKELKKENFRQENLKLTPSGVKLELNSSGLYRYTAISQPISQGCDTSLIFQ